MYLPAPTTVPHIEQNEFYEVVGSSIV